MHTNGCIFTQTYVHTFMGMVKDNCQKEIETIKINTCIQYKKMNKYTYILNTDAHTYASTYIHIYIHTYNTYIYTNIPPAPPPIPKPPQPNPEKLPALLLPLLELTSCMSGYP